MPPPVPQLSLPRIIVPGEDTASSSATTTSGETSRWLILRSTATSLTGLGAAMSEESMRRLRFCLNWLMYATQHIDKQILLLKEFTEAVQKTLDEYAMQKEAKVNERKRKSRTRARDGQSSSTEEEDGAGAPITPDQQATLHALRVEIVNTVRQVVDVVSKYAGGSSPASKTSSSTPPPNSPSASPSAPQEGLDESARLRVKGFILSLPMRWKDKVIRMGIGPGFGGLGGLQSQASALSPGEGSEPSSPREGTALAALHTAQRVLALATESLDMMRGVMGVVRESLERADGWVGRFGTQPVAGPVSPRTEGGDEWDDSSTMSPLSRRRSISIPSLSRSESSSSIAQSGMDVDGRSPTPVDDCEENRSPRLAMGRMSIGEVVNPISEEREMQV